MNLFFPYFTTLRDLCREKNSWHSILKSKNLYMLDFDQKSYTFIIEWMTIKICINYTVRLTAVLWLTLRNNKTPETATTRQWWFNVSWRPSNLHLGILYFVNDVQCDGFFEEEYICSDSQHNEFNFCFVFIYSS